MQRVELQTARFPLPPAEVFNNCAKQAKELGIEAWDSYGDFADATGDTSWLRKFELEVARDLGKEDAISLPSGVMAQQIALLIYRESAKLHVNPSSPSEHERVAAAAGESFVVHHSSHLLIHEKDSYRSLLGMRAIVVAATSDGESVPVITPGELLSSQGPLTAQGVREAVRGESASSISAVLVECPHREIGGKCTPLDDLAALRTMCDEAGWYLHMDGARLWEAAGSTEYRSLSRAQLCRYFDSVYVSFYKGLGALAGAMLVGTPSFIDSARVWARRMGGNLYTLAPYAIPAWAGYRENRDTFIDKQKKLEAVVAAAISSTEPYARTVQRQGPLLWSSPARPVCSLLHLYMGCSAAKAEAARDAVEQATGIRVFNRIRGSGPDWSYIELNLGPANGAISVHVWEQGWAQWAKAVQDE